MMTATSSTAIDAHAVTAHLVGLEILHGITLAIPKARWTSIVGPNGAGKSTLLKVLAHLLPHSGTVTLLGQPMARLPGRARAQQLAWLGQNESTGDDLTVHDVVMLGRLPHQPWLATPSDADDAAVVRAMQATQSWEWRGRSLGQLSSGERQRVLLARALAVEADVLLMDEPLANLDPPHQADWLALVQALVAKGKTVVSVLHEISMALYADEMVIMAQGRITHQGACDAATTHRALEAVFDHRIAVHALGDQQVALPSAAQRRALA
jgi:iron complex transport system ATP-binding protein